MVAYLPYALIGLLSIFGLVKYVQKMNEKFIPYLTTITISLPLSIMGFYGSSLLKVYNESQKDSWSNVWKEFMDCNYAIACIATGIAITTSFICFIICCEGIRLDEEEDD